MLSWMLSSPVAHIHLWETAGTSTTITMLSIVTWRTIVRMCHAPNVLDHGRWLVDSNYWLE